MLVGSLTRDQIFANNGSSVSLQNVDPSKLSLTPVQLQEKAASDTSVLSNKWIWIVAVLCIAIVALGIYFLVNRKK